MRDEGTKFPLTTERIEAVAQNTFREAVRNRAFIGLMLAALMFLLMSMVLSALAVTDQAERVLLSFGMFSISLFGVVIAIVMGVILVYKEVEKKTIYTVLPKPIHRFEFILGKYLGLLAILLVEMTVLAGVWFFILWINGTPVSVELLKALLLIFLEVSLITAVAVMFSAFSSPVLSGIFAVGVFGVGRVIYIVGEMLQAQTGIFVSNPETRPIGEALVAAWPDLQVFNASHEVLLGIPIDGSYLLTAAGYCASYIGVFLCVAILLFQRRDLV